MNLFSSLYILKINRIYQEREEKKMKFYTEEITTMVDGTSAVAITEKATDVEARSSFHQIMASAMINENVASVHAEAKNSVGGIYESATWTRPVPEPPTPEPVPEPVEE